MDHGVAAVNAQDLQPQQLHATHNAVQVRKSWQAKVWMINGGHHIQSTAFGDNGESGQNAQKPAVEAKDVERERLCKKKSMEESVQGNLEDVKAAMINAAVSIF